MPLHGKIVVIKRSGGDGTEFPLTATCLFGRKPDCDIRIQLPQVSKEHCRIDLNENKEIILTNLSSVNPTRVNGEALQQSERLKHGDVITIIDRSFRFEYPPAPTPKKRPSIGGKKENFKVLQDQQEAVIAETKENRISEVSTDPHLKDGTNHDNIQRSLEKTVEVESKEDEGFQQTKTTSPFNDLYQMIKKSLDVKTPRKSSVSLLQTPASRFCSPKPVSVRKTAENTGLTSEDKIIAGKDEAKISSGAAENINTQTPMSVKKERKSFQVPSAEMAQPEAGNSAMSEATPQKRNRSTPQRFTVCEVTEQVTSPMPKSPKGRRSKDATPSKPDVAEEQKSNVTSPKTELLKRTSPRNLGKVEMGTSKKRKSGELAADLPTQLMKRKRVSFGGSLSPELFDKRLPPDSPLRKGAAPRRSLCLLKPKQSLLRRASVIGLLKEIDPDSPAKRGSPSPKKSSNIKIASPKTPTSGKKSPKTKSSSPKAATPAKTSPKARTASPKAATPAKTSPKARTASPKAATPAKTSPKARTPSAKAATPAKTVGDQTPAVQGRFSVSRISTPSPATEEAVGDQVPIAAATPKLPLRRKSMKSTTRKSAVKAMCRRSGISRASIKATNSWADIVRFGQTKPQLVAAPKITATKKATKKTVSKSQTPARKPKGFVTTGHADSPVTIVVGRAHKQKVNPTGAAPRLVTNMALFKKNMKMDEDLTGISEMYKTPLNTRKTVSVIGEHSNSAVKTPVGSLVEPSVLNTPEEPGEMMVSPLNVSSSVKDERYNSEAVQRLFNGGESSSTSDAAAVETHSDASSEQPCTDMMTTPKQQPGLPDSLTGVKRIMKTPRQKVEPVEDLRGRLLKTPKQKPEQQECLTGVKRIMKTPRQKAEPIEDLRGKILKTPKQKPQQQQQQECLTGVKRIMKTPRQKAEPVEDLRGNILKTPKQRPEQQECLSGVKRIFKTPQREAELQRELPETPKAPEAGDASSECVQEVVEMPALVEESEITVMKTPNVIHKTISTIMKTPSEKSAPVEDMVGAKTPEEKPEPVEENSSILTPVKSPRLMADLPVEDSEGPELTEEPLPVITLQLELNEAEEQMAAESGVDVAKDSGVNDVIDEPLDQVPSESLDAMETISQAAAAAAVEDDLPIEEPKADALDDAVSEQQPEIEPAENIEINITTASEPDKKKSVRGRKAKVAEPKAAEEKQEAADHSEDAVVAAPVRGRRGKKTEAAAPPAVRQTTRGRNAKATESSDVEVVMEQSAPLATKVALKPKRGRNGKQASDDQAEMVEQVPTESDAMPEPEIEQMPPVDVNQEDDAAPLEEVVLKPKRGRKTKQPEPTVAEPQEVSRSQSDDVPQVNMEKDANEVCSDQLEVVPSASDDQLSTDATETVSQTPETKSLPEVEATTCDVAEKDAAAVPRKSVRGKRTKVFESKSAEEEPKADAVEDAVSEQQPEMETAAENVEIDITPASEPEPKKKSVRGRKAKVVEPKAPEEKQEAADHSEDAVVAAPVRGRRGKKTEAAAPPAVRQTTRGRNARSHKSTSEQPEMETTDVTDIPAETVSDQTSPVAHTEEAAVKPTRGRKAKTTVQPPQPEKDDVSDELLLADDQPQKSIPALVKPKRGRKTKPESVEHNDVTEDVVTVEPEPPVRAKRGRRANQEEKQDDDGKITSVEATKSEEPVKKLRRTRKVEQDHVEPRKEVQAIDMAAAEEADTPLVEPTKIEQASGAAKPRRGGRKAKQDTESETPAESTEVQEVPAVAATEKPKRGRSGKEVKAEAPEEKPELEAEYENTTEPEAPVVKRGRPRAVKDEVSSAVPAKRPRRGAAPPLEETNAESTVLVSEPATAEPAKRGRRAAAKPAGDKAVKTSDQADPTEDTKTSKRSVKWKTELQVFEIPQATPVKAVRGRKSKQADKVDAESQMKGGKKGAAKTEEKDLSGEAVGTPVAKRGRRGAKIADATAESTNEVKSEAEAQPRARRGRPAKK